MMTRLNTDCISCPNMNCLIKKHCTEANVDSFLAKKNTHQCKKGHNIFIEGSPVHGLFFVFSGKVKVFNTGIYGREQILRFATKGEMIGQRGFNSHQHYPTGAIAIEDSIMCHFSLDVMRHMLQEIHALTYSFMTFYAEELYRTETKVRKFAQMTVREKVIDALLYMNRKFGQTNGILNITLSRKEIADFAGTTEEQVIRILSSLKREGIMFGTKKELGIKDLERLKKEIDEHHYFIQS